MYFAKKRIDREQEPCLLIERLDEADSGTRNEVKAFKRWLRQEFRKLLRVGKRSDAEHGFLWSIDELRRKAFDQIVKTKILRAKIHADAARLGLAPNAARVDERAIQEETVAELRNALRKFRANSLSVA